MYCVVLVTAKNSREGQRIARGLLEQKLAACANLIEDVKSIFWWDGKIDKAGEVLLVLKTKRNMFSKIVKCVKKLHSYETPEIIALPIINGYNPYLKWIDRSTQKGKNK